MVALALTGALWFSGVLPGLQNALYEAALGSAPAGASGALSSPVWSLYVATMAAAGVWLMVGFLPLLPLFSAVGIGFGVGLALVSAQWVLQQQFSVAVPLIPASALAFLGTLIWAGRSFLPKRPSTPTVAAPDTADAERMMGIAFHGRGDFLAAYAKFRPLPTTDALKDNLYHLGKDFERLKDYANAKRVFKHLLRRDMQYKDARARYRHAKAHLQAQAGLAADSSVSHISMGAASSLPSSVQETLPRQTSEGQLGCYQLKRELGKGAMGVVYQGRDLRSGQSVAVKTLALQQEFEGAALIDAKERFFKEAEAAGRLQHPHIVGIYGAGEEKGLAYIAMELLAGTDLTSFARSPYLLPVDQVLEIGRRVALALDYAHAQHVVHRDIKPANIMFDAATDTVKVMDFGVARITDASKTRTGIVLGTPSFMSPEQLSGAKVDGRADLYALGVTLFQLLTGSLPLRADSMPELMRTIMQVDAPDVRTLNPSLPQVIAQLLAKALRKQPGDRYQTGMQMARDLAHAIETVRKQGGGPGAPVVYDSGRTPAGQNMMDLEKTVLEHPKERAPVQRSMAPVG